MAKDIVIKADNVSKKFTRSLKRSMFYGSTDVAKNMLGIAVPADKLRKGEFWSVKDISFDLRKGEALGIIGRNGSGKTTLLRLLNGIFPPDVGEIMVKGKIGALIAVGAGFHPHMTGRENIYLNGTILGMTKEEIDRKLEDIIKFANIGNFIDASVATYSSGMTVRLGFSIAIHSDPEILLADEVLAVGDLEFTLKCYRKIAEFRENGGSIILVSHGLQLVRNTCDKVLWMHQGEIREYGDTQKVCDEYERFVVSSDSASESGPRGVHVSNDPQTRIKSIEFLDKNDKPSDSFKMGEAFKARIHFECDRVVNKPIFTFSMANTENIQVISNYTSFDDFKIDQISGKGYLDFNISELNIKPDDYRCTVTFTENNDINNVLEWYDKTHKFSVVSNDHVFYGLVNPFPKWQLHNDKG